MQSVIRVLAVYLFIMIVFRLSGRRTLGETTVFDFVLLLIISETTQQAMVDEDHSIVNAFILIMTMVFADVVMSMIKQRFGKVEKVMNNLPMIIVEDGKPLEERMKKARIDISDILENARMQRGLERMEQIKYAVLEKSGSISIIPKRAEEVYNLRLEES